jgi:hypothetical protein
LSFLLPLLRIMTGNVALDSIESELELSKLVEQLFLDSNPQVSASPDITVLVYEKLAT